MPRVSFSRFVAVLVVASGAFQFENTMPARADDAVVFKIWNDTKTPITQLYDKHSDQDFWGINDLQSPVQPGHYFYIRIMQNSYARCPGILRDVKLVFADGAVKTLRNLEVCKYDVHVNKE